MRYFDSSVLLKLYLSEPNSAQAVALVQEQGGRPPITSLHRLEIKAAIGQKYGRGEIAGTERDAVLTNFESDLAMGVYAEMSPTWTDVFTKAENLATAHAAKNFCRSLDTLHVALALELGVAEFCTFDGRQTVMAKAAGLAVLP
ncbi:MAG: type II toxin-antitoxin system VapC family toxin [Chthoniobacteraceae bacterium]